MKSNKILHVTSELFPYTQDNPISKTVNQLALKSHEEGWDVRVFMPKFGFINERRYQLHEVIRLSGINLIINDLDQPLIVKVASLPGERMQVYFIDNEEYFKRKTLYFDENSNFHNDNHERSIFFIKGVIETIKKLNWIPNIIHIHGFMASFLPIYLKTYYVNNNMFEDSLLIQSIYNHFSDLFFNKDLFKILSFDGLNIKNLKFLNNLSISGLIKDSIQYCDIILRGEDFLSEDIDSFINSQKNKINYINLKNPSKLYFEFIKEEFSINSQFIN